MECGALWVQSDLCFLLSCAWKKNPQVTDTSLLLNSLGVSSKMGWIHANTKHLEMIWGWRSATYLIFLLTASLPLVYAPSAISSNYQIVIFHSFIVLSKKKSHNDSNFSRALFILITASHWRWEIVAVLFPPKQLPKWSSVHHFILSFLFFSF